MIELRPLNELDPERVAANLAATTQRLGEANPNLELRRGVFAELLAYYHAVLDEQRDANIRDYQAARSLQQIEADPTLSDPDLVDDVLSNFGVTRLPGEQSQGEVTVVVSDDVTVTIAQGSIWESRGKQFTTPRVYTAKTEEAQVLLPGDRLLTAIGNGNFAFTIDVVAVDEGTESDIPRESLVVPQTVPPNYVTSYAANDFTGGRVAQTNQELLTRLQEGIAAKAMSNRVNMTAMLREIEAFANITAMSIIGFGDVEMHRDQHSIIPVSLGCRVDWYVRSQEMLFRQKLTVTATLVEKTDDDRGLWQFSLGRDAAPGFYEVVDIRPTGLTEAVGGYEITSDVRGYDLTGDGFIPDIQSAAEAAYSRFSTGVLRFLDTDTDTSALAIGATADYDVYPVTMPLIADIQTTVSSRDVRSHGADCLVRAPVPAFVSLNFTIEKKAGEDDPDTDAIKAALVGEINRIGFIGRLQASQLYDVIHGYLKNDQTVTRLDMLARIRTPESETVYRRSGTTIEVPDNPDSGVTARTVQFFADPAWIGITVETSIPSD